MAKYRLESTLVETSVVGLSETVVSVTNFVKKCLCMESVIILYFIFGAWHSYLLDDNLRQIFLATTQKKINQDLPSCSDPGLTLDISKNYSKLKNGGAAFKF